MSQSHSEQRFGTTHAKQRVRGSLAASRAHLAERALHDVHAPDKALGSIVVPLGFNVKRVPLDFHLRTPLIVKEAKQAKIDAGSGAPRDASRHAFTWSRSNPGRSARMS